MTDKADLREKAHKAITKAFAAWNAHHGNRHHCSVQFINQLTDVAVSLLPTPTVGEGWKELAELSAKAPPGPWSYDKLDGGPLHYEIAAHDGSDFDLFVADCRTGKYSAAFIVAAVNYIRSALSASPREGGST